MTYDGASPASRSATSRHLRGSTLLLAGRLIALVIGLVTEVVLVRYLAKEDYGAFAWALSIVSLGASFCAFGFDKAAARFVAIHHARDPVHLGGVLTIMGATIGTLGVLTVGLVLVFHDAFATFGIATQAGVGLLVVMIALAPLRALDAWLVALLAIFATPMAILVRRYLLAPTLEFIVVAAAALVGAPVMAVGAGFVAAAAFGVAVAASLLIGAVGRASLSAMRPALGHLPTREVYGYALPLLSSDFVFVLRGSVLVILLEALRSTTEVADFRAVMPIARTNVLVLQTFALLFTPAAARFLAARQHDEMNALYWRSAVWIAVATLPILVLSFSLAGPVTVFLFGSEYRDASVVLAVLAFGYYANAAFGFNSLTLRMAGVVRYIFWSDIATLIVSLPLSAALIVSFGALGAAISLSVTLVVQNLLYHVALHRAAGVQRLPRRYLRTYASIGAAAGGLLAAQLVFDPALLVGFGIAAVLCAAVVYLNRSILDVTEIFPELMRIPGVRRFLGPR